MSKRGYLCKGIGNGSPKSVRPETPETERDMSNGMYKEPDTPLMIDGKNGVYDIDCYDGYAEGTLNHSWTNDDGMPENVRLEYPTREEVLSDRGLTRDVMEYKRLYKRSAKTKDITYGDIMQQLGTIIVGVPAKQIV